MNRKQLQEFNKWQDIEQSTPRNVISKKSVLAAITKDLSLVSKMDAEEYTLYRKWLEIQDNKDAKNYKGFVNDDSFRAKFEDNKEFANEFSAYLSGLPTSIKPTNEMKAFKKIEDTKWHIWRPPSMTMDEGVVDGTYDETQGAIYPNIIHCKDKSSQKEYWSILRNFLHTQENKNNVGRNLFFIVESYGQILGVFALSSDFKDLKGRDDYIGWSRKMRSQKPYVMVNHTAIASTVLPTQPLGFNYTGGKLIALMAMSDVVEKAWQEKYGYILAGVTTTSLYGANAKFKGSQYSNLNPYWEELGESEGETSYETTEETKKLAREFLRQKYSQKYWEWFCGKNDRNLPMTTNATQRSITFLYDKLGIPKSAYKTGHKRGIYFAHFYENFREYLKKEITEKELIRRQDIKNDVESLSEYWKEKHAIPRIMYLQKIDKKTGHTRLKHNFDLYGNFEVFYSDLAFMTWEETKNKYLPQVGNWAAKQTT